ncbi:MAG: hypothetical protein HUK20_02775 [Fibrobacter sp.]|nr:hypothetical protein [Fibrobacter sp.]
MIDVLKAFYTMHYNFGALSILLLMLLIFLLTKKNVKGGIIVLVILVAFNIFLYKRTDGKSWTLVIDPPASTDPYGNTPEPTTLTFSALKNWTITDEKGEVHHWCWFDAAWDEFANTDIVAKIWGDNAGKKIKKSTESRTNGLPE